MGSWVFLRFARQRGMDPEALTSLAWRVILLGIIGSRLLFVLTHLSDFTDRPLSAFALWEGGLQFWRVLIAIIVIVWWQRSHREVNILTLTDGIVLGLVPGLMIGRIGCYAVGEHFGTQTTFFLGVKYLGGETREGPIAVGTVIHNTALYEFILLAPLAALLFWMARRETPDRRDDRHVPALVRDPAVPDRLPAGVRRAGRRSHRRPVHQPRHDRGGDRPRVAGPSARGARGRRARRGRSGTRS